MAQEESPINRLPLEVLDKILSYLSPSVRKNVRLVCKSWYDRGQLDEKLQIIPIRTEREGSNGLDYGSLRHHQYLENCGFKRINLDFVWTDLTSHELPVSVWEKIGVRIRSLKLYACRLGNRAVENIFSHCENLQVLEIGLDHFDPEISFCSLKTLEKLQVLQKTLHTFEIYYTAFCRSGQQSENDDEDIDIDKWKKIFRVLRQIFPNVKHYRTGSLLRSRHDMSFQMKFSLGSGGKIEESGLIGALGNSMSLNNTVDWKRALQALSTVSLSSVSLLLRLGNYEEDDVNALVNFFTDHKELKRIELLLRGNKTSSPYSTDEPVMAPKKLVSILFHILEECSQLREFYFLNDWFPHLKETQCAQIVKKTAKLTKFVVNNLLIEGCTIQRRISFPYGEPGCTEISTLAPYYPHLQHLILGNAKKYWRAINHICKYMTNLKTLEINVTYWIFQKNSFKRLQNLERLKIYASDEHKLKNRDWYEEFEFPKLHYLYCFLPEEASILDSLGRKMPALKEVDFSQTDCATQHLGEYPPDIIRGVDMTRIFARCPTLRSLHYYRGTYFYEPFTQKVIFEEK